MAMAAQYDKELQRVFELAQGTIEERIQRVVKKHAQWLYMTRYGIRTW
jgi:hypothetical protein